jgi:hypothetical protein
VPQADERVLNYTRDGPPGPVVPPAQRVVVERFPDGGVTVWARAQSRRGAFAAQALVTFVLVACLIAGITRGRPWLYGWTLAGMPRAGLIGLAVIVGGWFVILYQAWRREQQGERAWNVVGIGPETIYADVEGSKSVRGGTFELPRASLRDVRLTHWRGKGTWAKSVEIVVDGAGPIDLCWGFNEREIWEAYQALSGVLGSSNVAK